LFHRCSGRSGQQHFCLFPRKDYLEMKTREFHQQVSQRLGEDIKTVRQRGFSIVRKRDRSSQLDMDESRRPLIVDWDDLELQRAQARS
jgi:type IV secretory pathway TraG/TraD family ATPase VirD4